MYAELVLSKNCILCLSSYKVFVNADRQSGFGTPWEVMFYGNYTIRSKGGNVPGYSALFSYIPELKLSMSIT